MIIVLLERFYWENKGVTISESKFADNQAGGAGAIVFQNAPENRIVASTFSANKGDYAGAVYFHWRSKDNRIENSNMVGPRQSGGQCRCRQPARNRGIHPLHLIR